MGVRQFYKGKNVLVTGATGFMGKCLVEKLLRTFPEVGQVFVMIRDRPKFGTYLQRYEALLQNQLFTGLRSANPDFADKIIPVYGDLLLPKFGLKSADLADLNSSVHVVFHGAATVTFREPIRNAVKNKIIALRELCDICRHFQNLESLVHISTVGINLPDVECEERIYPIDVSTVVTAYEKNDDAELAAFERRTKGSENMGMHVYVRTKKMGENVLVANSTGLPLVIVRPSNVLGALNEPYPGWRDGPYGLGLLVEQVGKGARTMVFGDPELCMTDIIPVDMSINVCLAAAWYRATHLPRQLAIDKIPIFNSVSGTVNPLYQSQIYEYAQRFCQSKHTSRKPVTIYKSKSAYKWNALTKPLLWAFPMTCWLALSGRKNRMVKETYYRYEYMRVWFPVVDRNRPFRQDNVDYLQTLMSPSEKQLLPMDPRTINWETYMENYCRHL